MTVPDVLGWFGLVWFWAVLGTDGSKLDHPNQDGVQQPEISHFFVE